MKKLLYAAIAACALVSLHAQSHGQTPASEDQMRIVGLRIDVSEPERALRFYEQAFGLRKFQGTDHKAFVTHYMGFGATAEEARASSKTRLVLFSYPAGTQIRPPSPYAAFSVEVPDIEATVAKVEAAGGKLARPLNPGASGKVSVALVADPDGNRIELLKAR